MVFAGLHGLQIFGSGLGSGGYTAFFCGAGRQVYEAIIVLCLPTALRTALCAGNTKQQVNLDIVHTAADTPTNH